LPTSIAEELNAADVPSACTTICKPIVQLTNACDVDPGKVNDDDNDGPESDEAIEAQCICSNKSFNVGSIAALCASCIQQNGNGTAEADMDKIMSACSFSSTSYSQSATALVAQITVSATKPVATGMAAGSSTATAQGQATQTAASTGLGARTDVSGAVGFGMALLGLV
ncbi:hypothetical protein K469DRAFT_541092, partial [Zopfia rhizophila CBS 207.26]